jgi:hypothetical protein
VPEGNIVFDVGGRDRTLVVIPAPDRFGTTTITLEVKDAEGGTVSDSFRLTVISVNDPPTISAIGDEVTDKNVPTRRIPFVIGDLETPAVALKVSGASLNATLVPPGNISFGGDGTNRTVTITPGPDQVGDTSITITVTDGDGTSTNTTFRLTVRELSTLNTVPLLSLIADQRVVQGETLTFKAEATDVDEPKQNLGFSLGAPIVLGASIDPLSGEFRWTPTKEQSPSTNKIVVMATDDGSPPQTASQTVTIRVTEKDVAPVILRHPRSQLAKEGIDVELSASAIGTGLLTYQWYFDGRELVGATSDTLRLPAALPRDSGTYSVEIRNAFGAARSDGAAVIVGNAPIVTSQPRSADVPLGGSITLSASASGEPPPFYQWRRNGANIPGANQATYPIVNAQPEDGGTYQVAIENVFGAITSDLADVTVIIPLSPPPGDNFAQRAVIPGDRGSVSGSNAGASREGGEPQHAGKRGANSVWYRWVAPAKGIATVKTTGSTFDTLLAIYTGAALPQLAGVVSNDDSTESFQFFTSKVTFNVDQGQEYQIAVDGLEGANGDFVLSWALEQTLEEVPLITTHPVSQIVPAGTNVEFLVLANATASYQWFFKGTLIQGATTSRFTINNVQSQNVGSYFVQVSLGSRTIQSVSAELQLQTIDTGPPVNAELARDKLADVFRSSGPAQVQLQGQPSKNQPAPLFALSHGVSLVLDYSSVGATKDEFEPNHCGEIGGASTWAIVHTKDSGAVEVSTAGSTFPTVLAVYKLLPEATGDRYQLVACDGANGPGGSSHVVFAAQPSTDYFVAVDGVKGASGEVRLREAMPAAVDGLRMEGKRFKFRLRGQPGQKLDVQSTVNFVDWESLLKTSLLEAGQEYEDTEAAAHILKFYRIVEEGR